MTVDPCVRGDLICVSVDPCVRGGLIRVSVDIRSVCPWRSDLCVRGSVCPWGSDPCVRGGPIRVSVDPCVRGGLIRVSVSVEICVSVEVRSACPWIRVSVGL